MARNKLWEDFAVWLESPESSRGSVASEEAWAEDHKTTTRTLRRWKQDPEFEALRERVRLKLAVTTEKAPTDVSFSVDSDESAYVQVKSKLIEGAASGNPKYMELYFKTYGKPFVEEEAAARSADLASFEFEDLVLDALDTLGRDALVSGLTGKGWTVVPPEGDDDVA